MKKKIFAGMLAVGLVAASVAPVAMANFGFEKGVIYYNPLTGETDHSDCRPGTALCWYKSK